MKAAIVRIPSFTPSTVPPHATDAQQQADLDDLVRRASEGDRRAIGAIGIAFGPALLAEIRKHLGPFTQDAGDVLQDFFVAMLEGTSRFLPERDRAIPWMFGILRAMARTHASHRAREWDLGEGEP
jgi:DNA-directed RNA polymerase specialized sigma24 family protein